MTKKEKERDKKLKQEIFYNQLITPASQGMLGAGIISLILGGILHYIRIQMHVDTPFAWDCWLLILSLVYAFVASWLTIWPRANRYLARHQVLATGLATSALFGLSYQMGFLFYLMWVGSERYYTQPDRSLLGVAVYGLSYLIGLAMTWFQLDRVMRPILEADELEHPPAPRGQQLELRLAGLCFLATFAGTFVFGFDRSFALFMGGALLFFFARLTAEGAYFTYLKAQDPTFYEEFHFKKSIDQENVAVVHETWAFLKRLLRLVAYIVMYLVIMQGILVVGSRYENTGNWQTVVFWLVYGGWLFFGVLRLYRFFGRKKG